MKCNEVARRLEELSSSTLGVMWFVHVFVIIWYLDISQWDKEFSIFLKNFRTKYFVFL